MSKLYIVTQPIDVFILHIVHFDIGKVLYAADGYAEDGYVLVSEVKDELPTFEVPKDSVEEYCKCGCS